MSLHIERRMFDLTIGQAAPHHSENVVLEDHQAYFHPDFECLKSDDHCILQSASGLNFCVSTALLIAQSPFFADLFSFPKPDTLASAERETIRLPSATSHGLAFVLFLVSTSSSVHKLPAFAWACEQSQAQIIKESLEVAHAYDFGAFCATLMAQLDGHPFMQFAVAAVAGYETLALSKSRQTIDLNLHTMSPTAKILLENHVPEYYSHLRVLHAARRRAKNSLLPWFKHRQPIFNDLNDFGKKCYKGDGCHGVRQWGDFSKMRRAVAETAWRAILEGPMSGMEQAVRDAAYCERCAYRLLKTFGKAIEEQAGGVPSLT